MTIVKRKDLGRPLTWDELDNNFDEVGNLLTQASSAVETATNQAQTASEAAALATQSSSSALNSSTIAQNAAENAEEAASDAVAEVSGNIRTLWQRALAEAGLNLVSGSFEDGAMLSGSSDVIWYESGSQVYKWAGTFPKTVAANSDPYTTGGISSSAWVDTSSLLLRNELYNNVLKFVTPEMVGTGVNAIITAAENAISLGLPLITSQKTYQINQQFKPSAGFVWYSNNSELSQLNTGLMAAFTPASDTRVYGRLRINMSTSSTSGWQRCGVLHDDYNNTTGVITNVHFDEIYLSGGLGSGAISAVTYAGGTNNHSIGKISLAPGHGYSVAMIAHWGNFTQHYYDSTAGSYQHVSGYLPTTHPNNIKIGEVDAGLMSVSTSDWVSPVILSAAYDIDIGKIRGTVTSVDNDFRMLCAVMIGDLGFAYADTTVKSHRARNIRIGSISGSSTKYGYYEVGVALYSTRDSGSKPVADYYGYIDVNVGAVTVSRNAAATATATTGAWLDNRNGQTRLGYLRAGGFSQGVVINKLTSNVTVDKFDALQISNTVFSPAFLTSADMTGASDCAKNILFREINVDGFNTGGNSPSVAIIEYNIIGFKIENLNIITMNNTGDVVRSGAYVGTNYGQPIEIASMTMLDSANTKAYVILNAYTGGKFVKTGKFTDFSGNIQRFVSGGIALVSSGRARIFDAADASAALTGLAVYGGDKVNIISPSATTPATYVCVTPGVVGSGASLQPDYYSIYQTSNTILPATTATYSLGSSTRTWNNAFFQNAATVVSDENHKTDIQEIPEELLDAWENVGFKMWKMKSAVDEKGQDQARYHFGVIAQDIVKVLTDAGLDWRKYGIVTYDKWDAVDEVKAVYDSNGNRTVEALEGREAGEIYMVRMEEIQAIESAYIRRKIRG